MLAPIHFEGFLGIREDLPVVVLEDLGCRDVRLEFQKSIAHVLPGHLILDELDPDERTDGRKQLGEMVFVHPRFYISNPYLFWLGLLLGLRLHRLGRLSKHLINLYLLLIFK